MKCETCGGFVEFESDGPVYAGDRPVSWPITGFDCVSCTDLTCFECGDKDSKACNSCIEWRKTATCAECGNKDISDLAWFRGRTLCLRAIHRALGFTVAA